MKIISIFILIILTYGFSHPLVSIVYQQKTQNKDAVWIKIKTSKKLKSNQIRQKTF